MTHTLHRLGDEISLSDDLVFLSMSAKDVNYDVSKDPLLETLRIVSKYDCVNIGVAPGGNMHKLGRASLHEYVDNGSTIMAVVTDKATMTNILRDLKEADVGMSVVISGLMKNTDRCCREAGLTPHTMNNSLGVHGKLSRLSDPDIREITTMCGHGMVPAKLVLKTVMDVILGRISIREGAVRLTKPCHCGIVNTDKIERLITRMSATWYVTED